VTRPLADRRFSRAAFVLVAGFASGALNWLALTTGVLPLSFALACSGGVLCAAAVVIARSPRGRSLAQLGVAAAVLPIVTVIFIQLASEG
jgi:hypothetical protein